MGCFSAKRGRYPRFLAAGFPTFKRLETLFHFWIIAKVIKSWACWPHFDGAKREHYKLSGDCFSRSNIHSFQMLMLAGSHTATSWWFCNIHPTSKSQIRCIPAASLRFQPKVGRSSLPKMKQTASSDLRLESQWRQERWELCNFYDSSCLQIIHSLAEIPLVYSMFWCPQPGKSGIQPSPPFSLCINWHLITDQYQKNHCCNNIWGKIFVSIAMYSVNTYCK